MSRFPCDVHGRRVSGPLEAAYPSLVRGRVTYFRKMRVCSVDLDSILGSERYGLLEAGDDTEALVTNVCGSCGQRSTGPNSLDSLYLPVYRRGQERQDYYGEFCPSCGDRIIAEWKLSVEDRVGGPVEAP